MIKLTRLQRKKDQQNKNLKSLYPKANPHIKDTVFKKLFSEPEYLRELASELVGPLPADAEIEKTTIEYTLASNGLFNDLSFELNENKQKLFIVLMEAQSTWQESIVMRLINYFSEQVKRIIKEIKKTPYNVKGSDLPKIRFYCIYTGDEKVPDTFSFKKDFVKDDYCSIDATVKIFTVKNSTGILKEYAQFCEIYNRNIANNKIDSIEAVRRTVEECIKKGILKKFLLKHRMEVYGIMEGIYSQQVIWQTEQQLAREKLNEARAQADEAKERADEAEERADEAEERAATAEKEKEEALKQATEAKKENQLLKAQEKQTILDLYNQGVSLQILIHTYHKTPEEIEKIINKQGLDSLS